MSVSRNRSKRMIKECYRLKERELKPGYDLVFTTDRDISKTPFKEVGERLESLYKKGHILK